MCNMPDVEAVKIVAPKAGFNGAVYLYNVRFFDMEQIQKSGQCFRIRTLSDGVYSVVAYGYDVVIEQTEVSIGVVNLKFFCDLHEFETLWLHYFDLEVSYKQYIQVAETGCEYVQKAATAAKGVRILRQEPWEALITFILSTANNIPRITNLVNSLCEKYGNVIIGKDGQYHLRKAFPTPERLHQVNEQEFRDTGVGFRAKALVGACERYNVGWYALLKFNNLTESVPVEDKSMYKTMLKSLNGVGDKVANCVMLFGFHDMNAFPEDTWIKKILASMEFDKTQYEPYLGIIQQYMYFYERSLAGKI